MNERLNALLSRKFLFAVICILAGLALVIASKITGDQFLEFIKWIAGYLILGQAAQNTITSLVKDTNVSGEAE